jgi:hypothetical protein
MTLLYNWIYITNHKKTKLNNVFAIFSGLVGTVVNKKNLCIVKKRSNDLHKQTILSIFVKNKQKKEIKH